MKEIIIPIVTGLMGALITALVSIYIARRKERKEDKDRIEREKKEIFENRPEYKIVEYKDYISRTGYGIKLHSDIDVFLTKIIDIKNNGRIDAIYRKSDFNKSEWCCVIYTFENVGKTDIVATYLICNHKRTKVLLNSYTANMYLNECCLNYSVSCDKKIRCGERITIKLCYHKDHVIESCFDAILSLGIKDVNGNYWEQPLFVPFDKLYDSFRITFQEFRNDILTEDAEAWFRENKGSIYD